MAKIFKDKSRFVFLAAAPILFVVIFIFAANVINAQTDTPANTAGTFKEGEKCTIKTGPRFSITGVSPGVETETTCPIETPYCDSKNQVCVQCLTPDSPDYNSSKEYCSPTYQENPSGGERTKTTYSCISGRCVALETSLPILKDLATGDPIQITGIASYIIYIYNFGLRIAGVLAFLLIIIYGFFYIMSAGNETATKSYREKLANVLLGVVVLLGSYIILTTINPTLTQLREPRYVIDLPKKGGFCDLESKICKAFGSSADTDAPSCDTTNIGAPCRCTIGGITWSKGVETPLTRARLGETVSYRIETPGCDDRIRQAMGINETLIGTLRLYEEISSRKDPERKFLGEVQLKGDTINGNLLLDYTPYIKEGDTDNVYLFFKGTIRYCARIITNEDETKCTELKDDLIEQKSAPLKVFPADTTGVSCKIQGISWNNLTPKNKGDTACLKIIASESCIKDPGNYNFLLAWRWGTEENKNAVGFDPQGSLYEVNSCEKPTTKKSLFFQTNKSERSAPLTITKKNTVLLWEINWAPNFSGTISKTNDPLFVIPAIYSKFDETVSKTLISQAELVGQPIQIIKQIK